MTYESTGCIKHSQLDNFENGCIDNGTSRWIDYPVSGATLDDVLGHIKDFTGCESGAIEINSLEEPGRIDVQVMETIEGYKPSMHQVFEWKAGRFELYLCDYSFQFQRVIREVVELV